MDSDIVYKNNAVNQGLSVHFIELSAISSFVLIWGFSEVAKLSIALLGRRDCELIANLGKMQKPHFLKYPD